MNTTWILIVWLSATASQNLRPVGQVPISAPTAITFADRKSCEVARSQLLLATDPKEPARGFGRLEGVCVAQALP